jgi:uncharacterized membrane protein
MLIMLSFLLSCSGKNQDSSELDCNRTPPLDYNNFGKGYLDKHCVGCHHSLLPQNMREGAPMGVDLDTYSLSLEWADRIEARATGDVPTMPPGGGPTESEREMLQEWLSCSLIPEATEEGGQ